LTAPLERWKLVHPAADRHAAGVEQTAPWRAAAIVEATTNFADPARVAAASTGLGTAMASIESRTLPDEQLLAQRGW
jgi:pyridoxal biosynthesis lyase PdxS